MKNFVRDSDELDNQEQMWPRSKPCTRHASIKIELSKRTQNNLESRNDNEYTTKNASSLNKLFSNDSFPSQKDHIEPSCGRKIEVRNETHSQSNLEVKDNNSRDIQPILDHAASEFSYSLDAFLPQNSKKSIEQRKDITLNDGKSVGCSTSASNSSAFSRVTSASLYLRKRSQKRKDSRATIVSKKNVLNLVDEKYCTIPKINDKIISSVTSSEISGIIKNSTIKGKENTSKQLSDSDDMSTNWKIALNSIPLVVHHSPEIDTGQDRKLLEECKNIPYDENGVHSSGKVASSHQLCIPSHKQENIDVSSSFLNEFTTSETNIIDSPATLLKSNSMENKNTQTSLSMRLKDQSDQRQMDAECIFYSEASRLDDILDEKTIANICIENSNSGLSSVTRTTYLHSLIPSTTYSKNYLDTDIILPVSSNNFKDDKHANSSQKIRKTGNKIHSEDLSSVVRALKEKVNMFSKNNDLNKTKTDGRKSTFAKKIEALAWEIHLQRDKSLHQYREHSTKDIQESNNRHKLSNIDFETGEQTKDKAKLEMEITNKKSEQQNSRLNTSNPVGTTGPDFSRTSISAQYWAPYAIAAAAAVIDSCGGEHIAQIAAQQVLMSPVPKSFEEMDGVHRSAAAKVSVAVVESGGTHMTAAKASIAVLKLKTKHHSNILLGEMKDFFLYPSTSSDGSTSKRLPTNTLEPPSTKLRNGFKSSLQTSNNEDIQNHNCNVQTANIIKSYAAQTRNDVERLVQKISCSFKKVQEDSIKISKVQDTMKKALPMKNMCSKSPVGVSNKSFLSTMNGINSFTFAKQHGQTKDVSTKNENNFINLPYKNQISTVSDRFGESVSFTRSKKMPSSTDEENKDALHDDETIESIEVIAPFHRVDDRYLQAGVNCENNSYDLGQNETISFGEKASEICFSPTIHFEEYNKKDANPNISGTIHDKKSVGQKLNDSNMNKSKYSDTKNIDEQKFSEHCDSKRGRSIAMPFNPSHRYLTPEKSILKTVTRSNEDKSNSKNKVGENVEDMFDSSKPKNTNKGFEMSPIAVASLRSYSIFDDDSSEDSSQEIYSSTRPSSPKVQSTFISKKKKSSLVGKLKGFVSGKGLKNNKGIKPQSKRKENKNNKYGM